MTDPFAKYKTALPDLRDVITVSDELKEEYGEAHVMAVYESICYVQDQIQKMDGLQRFNLASYHIEPWVQSFVDIFTKLPDQSKETVDFWETSKHIAYKLGTTVPDAHKDDAPGFWGFSANANSACAYAHEGFLQAKLNADYGPGGDNSW